MPVAPEANISLDEWRDAWRQGACPDDGAASIQHVPPSDCPRRLEVSPPWVLGGMESPCKPAPGRTGSEPIIFGRLAPETRRGEIPRRVFEIVKLPQHGTMLILASAQVSEPSEVEHMAREAAAGLLQSSAWLSVTAEEQLFDWAVGTDPLLRVVAESSPSLSTATRIAIHLRGHGRSGLFFPPLPTAPFRYGRSFFARALTTAALLHEEALA
jgi:hypothetical protein